VSDYLDLYENGDKLSAPTVVSVRAALQSDKSFASYDEAIAHLMAPGLPVETEFFWSQGLLMCCSSTRFSRTSRSSRLNRAWRASVSAR
jgi:hypothetical protein